jgi:hypothetical protein
VDTKAAMSPASTYNTASLTDYAPSTLVGVTVITRGWPRAVQAVRRLSEISDVPPRSLC